MSDIFQELTSGAGTTAENRFNGQPNMLNGGTLLAPVSGREQLIRQPPMVTGEEFVTFGLQRNQWLLDLVGDSVKVVERESGPAFVIEMRNPGWSEVSDLEGMTLCATYKRLNVAIADGAVKFTPGLDSLKLVDLEVGLDALVPGLFDAGVLASVLAEEGFGFGGQWFPPGVRLDLSKTYTDRLVAGLAGTGAAGRLAIALGVAAKSVPVVAAALLASAAAIKIAQTWSSTGEVGLKVVPVPLPPYFTIFPIPL